MANPLRRTVLALLLVFSGMLHAQSFQINLKNGEETSYDFDNIESVVFRNSNVKVYKTSGEEDSYSFFSIQKMMMSTTITSVDNTETESALKLYPNPVSDRLTIESNNETGSAHIINMLGKVVETVQLSNTSTSIDVSHYQAGMYFIVIDSSKYKFIKL